jgi:CheY-like chemotaxis protein
MNTNSALPNAASGYAPNMSRSALKALLVDDDPFQLDLMTEILRGLGVSDITQATGGTVALQKLAANANRFNLMLLDLHMPDMDGFQFMESVAKTGFAGGLIIVSGQSDEVVRAAAMVAKLRRFTVLGAVTKPVSQLDLSQLI